MSAEWDMREMESSIVLVSLHTRDTLCFLLMGLVTPVPQTSMSVSPTLMTVMNVPSVLTQKVALNATANLD